MIQLLDKDLGYWEMVYYVEKKTGVFSGHVCLW